MLEMVNCKDKGGIDIELQNLIQSEENRWRLVLKTIIDIIMHLAMEGSAFCGTNQLISNIEEFYILMFYILVSN